MNRDELGWVRGINSEGYNDPTAYDAMRNIDREEHERRMMNLKRGEIFYVNRTGFMNGVRSGKPAVIVSNDHINSERDYVQVVYCSMKTKPMQPTQTQIWSTRTVSTVLCETLTSVRKDRLGDYIGTCSESEIKKINSCLSVVVELGVNSVDLNALYSENTEKVGCAGCMS